MILNGRNRRHSKETGLTIVELIVSLGILSFIALSVTTMVTTSMHLDKLAQERSIATSLSSERIMQITSRPFKVVGDVADYALPEETVLAGPPPVFRTDYGVIPDYPDYARSVTFRYDVPVAGMMTLEVNVFWTHATGEQRSHTMIEIIEPGLE